MYLLDVYYVYILRQALSTLRTVHCRAHIMDIVNKQTVRFPRFGLALVFHTPQIYRAIAVQIYKMHSYAVLLYLCAIISVSLHI